VRIVYSFGIEFKQLPPKKVNEKEALRKPASIAPECPRVA
jgi:hypothetical protein